MQRALIHEARRRYHPQRVYTLWEAASTEAAGERLSREISLRWNAAAESLLDAVRALERSWAPEPTPEELDGIHGERPEEPLAGETFEPISVDDPPSSAPFEKLFREREAADLSGGGKLRRPVSRPADVEGAGPPRRRGPVAAPRQPLRYVGKERVDGGESAPSDRRQDVGPFIEEKQRAPAAQRDPGTAPRRRPGHLHEISTDSGRRGGARDRPGESGEGSRQRFERGASVPTGSGRAGPPDAVAYPGEIQRESVRDAVHGKGPGKSSRRPLSAEETVFEGSMGSFPRTSPPVGARQAFPRAWEPGIPAPEEGVDGSFAVKDRGAELGFPPVEDAASRTEILRDELRTERRRRKALREWRRSEF